MEKLSKEEIKKVMGGSGPGPGGCGSYLNYCGSIFDPPCCDGYVCTGQTVDGYSYSICMEGNPGGV